MGVVSCRFCARRAPHSNPKPWAQYSDREDEFLAPTSSAERRRRGVATTSLTDSELQEYAVDFSQPRRAEHAAHELKRRGNPMYA